jgi:hypothetical protein
MGRANELMEAGYKVGLESIPRVRELIDSVTTDSTDLDTRSALIGF